MQYVLCGRANYVCGNTESKFRTYVITDLKRLKPVLVKRNREVDNVLYEWSLERETCKPVLKLDFTAHGINGIHVRILTQYGTVQ
jgi:hypothetical protein